MRNALSISAAAVLLAVFLCLGITSKIWACSECLCFVDDTCTNEECGVIPDGDCSRTVFSPVCSGNYAFSTMTICNGSSKCHDCESCANLFELNGTTETFVANCHTSHCGQQDCEFVCPTVALIQNKSYVMYVCKIPCVGSTCTQCADDCKAYACLGYGLSSSPCTP